MKVIISALAFVGTLGACTTDPALTDRAPGLKYTEPSGPNKVDMRPSDWEREAIRKYHALSDADRENMSQRDYRDSVIYRQLNADEDDFQRFVRDLRSGRAVGNISADLALIVLHGLGVVTGGANTKRDLAAISQGLIGAKGSVEKELFNQEAITAISARMNAARLKALVPIERGITQPISAYPLERALRDLRAYAAAGTLVGAFSAITNDAGEEAEDAQIQISRFTRDSAYRASLSDRQTLSEAVKGLTDQQVMALTSSMMAYLGSESVDVRQELIDIYTSDPRTGSADNARNFLIDWISLNSAPSQLKRWSDEINKVKN